MDTKIYIPFFSAYDCNSGEPSFLPWNSDGLAYYNIDAAKNTLTQAILDSEAAEDDEEIVFDENPTLIVWKKDPAYAIKVLTLKKQWY